jgi:uncharacterized protein (TIGR03437 family)
VRAEEQARQQNVVIAAASSGGSAQASLTIVSSGAPVLRLPGARTVRSDGRVEFSVSASDAQNLPVAVAAKKLPRGASFNAATGEFAWTPRASDSGETSAVFEATDAAGMVTTGSVGLRVLSGKPVIAGLRNSAAGNARGACTPGARMTLAGAFVSDDQTTVAAVAVRINGQSAAIEAIRPGEIDFVCPGMEPGALLSMTVEIDNQLSDAWETTMEDAAPGLFSAMHARGIAALPRYGMDGSPALAGEAIRLVATGIDCAADPRMLVYFGGSTQPVTSAQRSSYAGICEVSAVVPASVSGAKVELFLEVVRSSGARVRSNAIQVAIE